MALIKDALRLDLHEMLAGWLNCLDLDKFSSLGQKVSIMHKL